MLNKVSEVGLGAMFALKRQSFKGKNIFKGYTYVDTNPYILPLINSLSLAGGWWGWHLGGGGGISQVAPPLCSTWRGDSDGQFKLSQIGKLLRILGLQDVSMYDFNFKLNNNTKK